MTKIKIIIVFMLSISSVGCSMDTKKSNWDVGETQSPLNCSYKIDAKDITLINGRYEQEIMPNSVSKISVMVLGEPVYGDLDQDGIEDSAVLLVYQSGGSGTFYYVAAALKKTRAYQGSNAILLGDRIADPNLMISNGKIITYYETRQAHEAMSVTPTVATTKLLMLKNNRLKVIKPQQTGLNEQDQMALELGHKVLAVKAAIQNPKATDAMQSIIELGHDQRYYILVRGWLLMQLKGDQSIADASRPDIPEDIQERIDFIKSAIRQIDLE